MTTDSLPTEHGDRHKELSVYRPKPAQRRRGDHQRAGFWRWARSLTPAVVVALLLATPPLSSGGAGTNQDEPEGAMAFVETLSNKVTRVLEDPATTLEGRRAEFRKIFQEAFDVPTIARFVAGPYWRKAGEGQRKQYLDLFGLYVAYLYADKFAIYSGEKLNIVKVRKFDKTDSLVKGRIEKPAGQSTDVAFRVRQTGEEFKIVDTFIENISLILTKRSEFQSILSREGMDGLLRKLRQKVTRLENNSQAGR